MSLSDTTIHPLHVYNNFLFLQFCRLSLHVITLPIERLSRKELYRLATLCSSVALPRVDFMNVIMGGGAVLGPPTPTYDTSMWPQVQTSTHYPQSTEGVPYGILGSSSSSSSSITQ